MLRDFVDPNLKVLPIAVDKTQRLIDTMEEDGNYTVIRDEMYNLLGFLKAANENFITKKIGE